MKFAVFAVVLALAVIGAHSSVIPLGGIVLGAQPAVALQTGLAGPLQVVTGPLAAGALGAAIAGPVVVAPAVPSAVAVAQTRGAVHVAPLPGHATSVTLSNLLPAPGTL